MQSERERVRRERGWWDAKGFELFPVEILDAGMAFELGPNVVVQRFRTCVDLLSVCASFFLYPFWHKDFSMDFSSIKENFFCVFLIWL